jgi:hypothetical protein
MSQLMPDFAGRPMSVPLGYEEVDVSRLAIVLMMWLQIFALGGCATPLLGGLTGAGPGGNSSSEGSSIAMSTNLTPASIFDKVEKSTKLGLVGPAAFLYENGALDATVITEQCTFHMPDPPFLVPEDTFAQKGWVFTGRLNSEDQWWEMQAMETAAFLAGDGLSNRLGPARSP